MHCAHNVLDKDFYIRKLCVISGYNHMISFLHMYFIVFFCQQVGDVRLAALQALQGLYENEHFVPQLELFTDRFKVKNISWH